jgi:putative protease
MVKTKEKQIGVVSNYFEHVGVIAIKLEAGLKIGDKIKIVGGEIEEECPVESMQIYNESVKTAKKGDDVGIKVSVKAKKGYRVFKV